MVPVRSVKELFGVRPDRFSDNISGRSPFAKVWGFPGKIAALPLAERLAVAKDIAKELKRTDSYKALTIMAWENRVKEAIRSRELPDKIMVELFVDFIQMGDRDRQKQVTAFFIASNYYETGGYDVEKKIRGCFDSHYVKHMDFSPHERQEILGMVSVIYLRVGNIELADAVQKMR